MLTHVQGHPAQVLSGPKPDNHAEVQEDALLTSPPVPAVGLTLDESAAKFDPPNSTPVTQTLNHNAAVPAEKRANLRKRMCKWDVNDVDVLKGAWVCDLRYPTIAEMVASMRDHREPNLGNAVKEKSVYFYTNLRLPTKAEDTSGSDVSRISTQEQWMLAWLDSRSINHYYYRDAARPGFYDTQRSFIGDNWDIMDEDQFISGDKKPKDSGEARNIFMVCYLQALAMSTQNADAYLFTQRGANWADDSVWAKVEYWKLTRNPNVQKIYRVDPAPGSDCSREVLWDRSKDKELAEAEACVIKD